MVTKGEIGKRNKEVCAPYLLDLLFNTSAYITRARFSSLFNSISKQINISIVLLTY